MWLHKHATGDGLGVFFVHSSMSAVLGYDGQSVYAADNRFLDGLTSMRRSQGMGGVEYFLVYVYSHTNRIVMNNSNHIILAGQYDKEATTHT